ncbi:MAG: class I SAM-dependent methyltransferase, partial [Desulfobaccales bacterium]
LSACDGLELFVSLDLGIFGDHYKFTESNLDFASRKIHAWCRQKGIPPERVRFFQANTQPPGKSDNDNLACQAPPWDSLPELQELLVRESFDVLFVDGKHTEDGLYQDMKTFWPCLRPGGLLLCDDLHDTSYRQFFPWAGETVASFERFTAEFAPDIEEHHVWPYPRVLPAGPAGSRPFGLIRKKTAQKIAVDDKPEQPDISDLSQVITTLARTQRRLYLRDQTPASLAVLITLAEELQPTRIVELGTCQGLSLRAWLAARTQARISAIDLSFAALRQSLEAAPLDLSRVTLLELDILKTEFSRLWEAGDRVLLYVDAHDQPQAPIMAHVLERALPALPPGSLVVVDDLWHSPDTLDPGNAPAFFQTRVLPEIDPLQCFPGQYASYWLAGAFMGFAETIPLLTWVNQQRLHLTLHPGAKLVSFSWPSAGVVAQEELKTKTGSYFFNPLQNFALAGAGRLSLDHNALAALYHQGQGVELFAQGKVREALQHFVAAGELCPDLAGVSFAQAVSWARLGCLAEA